MNSIVTGPRRLNLAYLKVYSSKAFAITDNTHRMKLRL
jgi:hypothetical protein